MLTLFSGGDGLFLPVCGGHRRPFHRLQVSSLSPVLTRMKPQDTCMKHILLLFHALCLFKTWSIMGLPNFLSFVAISNICVYYHTQFLFYHSSSQVHYVGYSILPIFIFIFDIHYQPKVWVDIGFFFLLNLKK